MSSQLPTHVAERLPPERRQTARAEQMVTVLIGGDGMVENIATSPTNPIQEMDQYRAAMAHSGGDPIEEIKAHVAMPGMTLWFPDTETWIVVAAGPTTDYQPSGLPNESPQLTTVIPIEIGPAGHFSRCWEVPAHRSLIQRGP